MITLSSFAVHLGGGGLWMLYLIVFFLHVTSVKFIKESLIYLGSDFHVLQNRLDAIKKIILKEKLCLHHLRTYSECKYITIHQIFIS